MFLKQPPVLNDHVVVLPQVFRSNFSLCSDHMYNMTNDHNMMSQAFYYLHIMTTTQSAYPKSHNKFSRYLYFKVIYNMLFYHNIVFCFEQKYTLIYFCLLRFFVSRKPVSIMFGYVKILSFIQRPNIAINSFGRYTQVLFIMTTCL